MIRLYYVFSLVTMLLGLAGFTNTTQAQSTTIQDVCPGSGIQSRTASFEPGGIILTAFDRNGTWAYDIDRDARYPLPQTAPCGVHCHLSPDARWISIYDIEQRAIVKMHLNGSQRLVLAHGAAEVSWWSADTLLVWESDHLAYLRQENDNVRQEIMDTNLITLQPGGYYGLTLSHNGENFSLELINTADETTQPQILGQQHDDLDAAAWSPDGSQIAYVQVIYSDDDGIGTELFIVEPGQAARQMTDLFSTYGAVHISSARQGDLAWSPDGTQIAFWVIEPASSEDTDDPGNATIHVLDTSTGALTRYCGYTTTEYMPNTSHLGWSPDGSHIAFAGDLPNDSRGYILMALNVRDGQLTELSNGVYPALGSPDVIAWGRTP